MTFAESRADTVPVQLPNGAIVKVEVASTGREDVGFDVAKLPQSQTTLEWRQKSSYQNWRTLC